MVRPVDDFQPDPGHADAARDALYAARDDVARYLPDAHPAIKKLGDAIDDVYDDPMDPFDAPDPEGDAQHALAELHQLLEDFERGIRTWQEVHDHVWPVLP